MRHLPERCTAVVRRAALVVQWAAARRPLLRRPQPGSVMTDDRRQVSDGKASHTSSGGAVVVAERPSD